jgi:hypothetical protein
MKKNRQKKLYHWFCILLVASLFSACGAKEHAASEALKVSLELPAGEAELFWYGVGEKKLSVSRDGKVLSELTWNQGQSISVDLKAGDQLDFTGYDASGRIVVMGSSTVSAEKKVSIPLRRIL